MGLFGGYQHTIDKKGRMFLPAKLRDDLGNGMTVCRSISGTRCLCVYSDQEWEKLVERISTLPTMKSIKVQRFLYEGSFQVEFDSQGRILIPPALREYAQLEGEAHIIGMAKYLEIWNPDLWKAERASYTPESIASTMEGLDF